MALKISSYEIECLEKAKNIIDADLSRHTNIEDLANRVALGKTKLKNGFQQLYGLPVYRYLLQQRMQLAMDLLTNTDKNFKQIARLTGYRHSSNFITAFSRHFGCTPGHVRRSGEV